MVGYKPQFAERSSSSSRWVRWARFAGHTVAPEIAKGMMIFFLLLLLLLLLYILLVIGVGVIGWAVWKLFQPLIQALGLT